jgi:two-component system OmpR family sensor kinase
VGKTDPQPILPAKLRVIPEPRSTRFGVRHGTFRPDPDTFTVNALDNPGVHYRSSAVAVPEGTLVVAISINPTNDTLNSLLRVELGASAAVILVLCILGVWIIRRGLRPLEDMTQTARAIASGDLTRRVPATDEESEVGRLGAALNVMLTQIETAFKEQAASEGRLRQFVADASHELRTPLTSIRGYTELLQRGAITDEDGRRKALARVEEEATRMGGLVDDLLLLARLDQGRPLEVTGVDLRAVFANAIADALTVDPDRPIELEAKELIMVAGDRDRLNQVAHNLVRNCLEHTPPGSAITVRVTRHAPFGVAQVIDAGPGIAPEELNRVFDRFYRGDASRSSAGTGLGLSIVSAIALALGGTARVESTPGHGATFTVEIPLDQSAEGARNGTANGHRPVPGREATVSTN